MIVRLDKVVPVAENIKSFHFIPQGTMRYSAGQFIELTLPHDNADKRGKKRWFTLSSSPTEDYVSITTKFALENGSTFKKTLAALKIGDEVMMSSAMGDFVLPKDASKKLVFVAGGIGVTPMRSMVKWLVDTNEQRDIQLLYAANNAREVAFEELFAASGIGFTKILREAPAGWPGETGTLDAQRIVDLSGGDTGKTYYVSGPEPMVEALEKGLKSLGVKQFVGDFFPNYTDQ